MARAPGFDKKGCLWVAVALVGGLVTFAASLAYGASRVL